LFLLRKFSSGLLLPGLKVGYFELGSHDLEQVEEIVQSGINLVSAEGQLLATIADLAHILDRLAVQPLDQHDQVLFLCDSCLAGPGQRRLPQ
jgi:hypothetical protein